MVEPMKGGDIMTADEIRRMDMIVSALFKLADEKGISYREAQQKYDKQVIEHVDSLLINK